MVKMTNGSSLAARQVHLDFHTSEFIPGVGSRFDKVQFQQGLLIGNVNSITIFAKCHHSWSYYPTLAGLSHPTLDFDLTGAMIEAAHEIGVRAPVYLTVGWSSGDSERLPECIERTKEGTIRRYAGSEDGQDDETLPIIAWRYMCPNGRYAELIYNQTREICERYAKLDGMFYDICFHNVCWCENCRYGMSELGFDPVKDEDAAAYNLLKWTAFTSRCRDILHRYHPDASLFFNGGAEMDKPEWHSIHTHIEMEDLPTTWGGYDKMPTRAKHFHKLGLPFLGMTGKFHTMWGEFGGYKSPDALRYEVAAMMAFGARCSVGDQLHPCGELDLETYRHIGIAYQYVKMIEPWCFDVEETARLGIYMSTDAGTNEGLVKMLLEKQMDFDIVLEADNLESFDVIILPDCVLLDEVKAEQFNEYAANGGKLLVTGQSGLNREKSRFLIDMGIVYLGQASFENDYLQVYPDLGRGVVSSPILCYTGGERVKSISGDVMASIREPYFNRTYGQYCSHQNTPYRLNESDHPGALRSGNIIYLAHSVCKMYYENGAQYHRDYFINAVKMLYTNPVLEVEMPSSGRVRLAKQSREKRYVLHLLYATPIQRGRAQVIEDLPPLYQVKTRLMIEEKINRVYLAPQIKEIPFVKNAGFVEVTIPKVQCHQIVVFEFI